MKLRTRLTAVLMKLAGVFTAAVGIQIFLTPQKLIDGGVTGISLLLGQISPIATPIWIVLINLPFLTLGAKTLSVRFAVRSAFTLVAFAIALTLVPSFAVTNEPILSAIFGGAFLGAGLGLVIRGGAVLDGTDLLALILNRKLPLSMGEIIFGINIIIFATAAGILGVEKALLSVVTYFAASKAADYLLMGIDQYMAVTIMSERSEEIRKRVTEELGRGLTVYAGKRGYRPKGEAQEIDILFTLVTRLELIRLKEEILKIDPNAFLFENIVNDAQGGFIRQRKWLTL